MDEQKYFEALTLIESFYSGDWDKISHLIRVSQNLNLKTFDERISALLYPTIYDGKTTYQDLETQFNTFVADIVSRIMPYPDEDEYTYVDRINKDETLSKIRYCILFDQYYQNSYLQKETIATISQLKYDIENNSFTGYGTIKC